MHLPVVPRNPVWRSSTCNQKSLNVRYARDLNAFVRQTRLRPASRQDSTIADTRSPWESAASGQHQSAAASYRAGRRKASHPDKNNCKTHCFRHIPNNPEATKRSLARAPAQRYWSHSRPNGLLLGAVHTAEDPCRNLYVSFERCIVYRGVPDNPVCKEAP